MLIASRSCTRRIARVLTRTAPLHRGALTSGIADVNARSVVGPALQVGRRSSPPRRSPPREKLAGSGRRSDIRGRMSPPFPIPADGDGTMTTAMAIPGNTADTFLVHFFGGGLADDRYVVERHSRTAISGPGPAKSRRQRRGAAAGRSASPPR